LPHGAGVLGAAEKIKITQTANPTLTPGDAIPGFPFAARWLA
jgi:hypothetical protein